MNIIKTRRIFKSASTSQSEVKDLLQEIFVGELLTPSKCLWLISPWISNIDIINNQSGTFTTVDPTWGRRSIRLAEVVIKILSLGSHIVVATRPDTHNDTFLSCLKEYSNDIGAQTRLTTTKREKLHIKGILGDTYFLSGSMNITFNGIELLEEQVTFDIDKSAVGEAQLVFYENYGGRL